MNDLLGDVFGGQAPSMASASVVPSMGGGGGVDLLGDMLGGASLSSVPSASPAHPPSLAQSTTAAFVVNAAGNHQVIIQLHSAVYPHFLLHDNCDAYD